MSGSAPDVLVVENLRTEFRGSNGVVAAVDGVSLSVRRGEVLGLVGESGSGKSVTGFSILGLVEPPGRVVAGRVLLQGQDILRCTEAEMRAIRGDRIAMVFQDPMTALHPLLRIGAQMIDAIQAHRRLGRREAWVEARDALGRVGISAPDERMQAFPHQLSGGMRQRVAIAIAMLNHPEVIIADEPTTGLDVTIQAQILAQVQKLAAESGTALIWITHDLAVVSSLADRVAVMYAGGIVEQGDVADVLDRPAHPYTAGLLASSPSRNRAARRLPQIPGSIASAHAAGGCRFQPRCGYAVAACGQYPDLQEIRSGHAARCWRIGAISLPETMEAGRG